MTESQYQKACDQQATEENFIAFWTEWFSDRGYPEEEAEDLAMEQLKKAKEYY